MQASDGTRILSYHCFHITTPISTFASQFPEGVIAPLRYNLSAVAGQVSMQASTEQLLNTISQMPQPELETFIEQVLKLRAQRQAPSLSAPESELLLKINQGIPAELQHRFNELIAKRQALTLTQAEHAELIQLGDHIEQLDAERIEHLAALAKLRQRSLTELMQDLGIQPPACV